MATAVTCPICESDREIAALVEKDGWPLLCCGDCDHVFVHPVPTDDQLAALYSFESGYQQAASTRADAPPLAKFRKRAERIARHRTGGALLDVGCSFGDFLRAARERGFEACGVEMNPDTAALAREAGFRVETGPLAQAGLPEASFDVVHLGDVIEHVADPAALLGQVRAVLRSDGLLVVATPNHDAPFPRAGLALQRLLGIPWSHATPPHHLHQFSAKSLERLLARTGFRPLETHYAPAELAYELRATGAPSRLKRALAARDLRGGLRAGFACAGVALAYPPLFLLTRLLSSGGRDADMTLIAARAA